MNGRFAALSLATLAAAGALAWVGTSLLSLPAHGNTVARTIVGGGDERRFDAALRLFQDSVDRPPLSSRDFVARARAEASLASQRGDPQLRSQAQTLLGVLALDDAVSQHKAAAAKTAVGAFQTALRLDPNNEQAAVDLELLLSHERRQRRAAAATKRPGRASQRRGGAHGATAATGEGGGY
jgi:hypothetical protein